MKNNFVTRQLAELQRMTMAELKDKYTEMFGADSPQTNATHLRKKLAYRIQEMYFGGFTNDEKLILNNIAQKDSMAKLEKVNTPKGAILKGTRFSRLWHDKIYEVTATGDGKFDYNGQLYNSLSRIAKEITGTPWNGKLFFGLESKRGKNANN